MTCVENMKVEFALCKKLLLKLNQLLSRGSNPTRKVVC